MDQNRFLPRGCLQFVIVVFPDHTHLLFFTRSLIYFFTIFDNMFLIAVRHEVNNLESSVVVQELEFAINLAL